MGKGNTNDEIMDYFDMDPELIPSESAFNQRRAQLTENAFPYLFNEFSSPFPNTTHSFKGMCILAADGAHSVYSTNSEILEDYNKPRLVDYKAYNHMHVNAFADDMSKSILDLVIQPGQHPDERSEVHQMIEHFEPEDPSKYFRVLKIKIGENNFEYVVTNLLYSFDLNDIKDIYHWRWGIEVSLRYFKHAACLLYFHSRKPEFVKQEIYARTIMYNFGVFIADLVSRESKKTKQDTIKKYVYEIDFSMAI